MCLLRKAAKNSKFQVVLRSAHKSAEAKHETIVWCSSLGKLVPLIVQTSASPIFLHLLLKASEICLSAC